MRALAFPEENDLYWSAGLMEGSATFCARMPKYLHEPIRPRVITCVQDAGTAEWLRTVWGGAGTIYQKFNKYAWELTGKNAADLMVSIYPTLGADNKAKIAEILLACGFSVPEDEETEDEVESE